MQTLSPTERPYNLDNVRNVIERLGGLDFLSLCIDLWFRYTGLTDDITERRDVYCSLNEMGPYYLASNGYSPTDHPKRREYGDIFFCRPQESVQLLTSPYPIRVELTHSPQKWKEKDIDEACRLAFSGYHMFYQIELDGSSNEYIITGQPCSSEVIGSFGILKPPFEK